MDSGSWSLTAWVAADCDIQCGLGGVTASFCLSPPPLKWEPQRIE